MRVSLIIKIVTATILMLHITNGGYAQGMASAAGKDGIFVYCGKDLPKKFSYVIERKKDGDATWQPVAETIFPKSVDGLAGNVLAAPLSLLLNQRPSDAVAQNLWRRAAPVTTLDSLYPYATMPLYVMALGCGYFDKISAPGTYSYKVYMVRNGSREEVATTSVSFPANAFSGILQPAKMNVADQEINLVFNMSGAANFGGAKIFRSKFGDTVFAQVPVKVLFTGDERGKLQLNITDQSVTPKMAYSYYAVPVDNLGNDGIKTDVINVYNQSKLQDVGQVLKITARGVNDDKSIRIAWQLINTNDLISIDVYRGTDYDKPFSRIASVPAKDTIYVDRSIAPATTYFYSIVANGNFSRSNPSARVNAVLKGSNNNRFPPQNVAVNRKGNIVKLTFNKTENDTRGYYVYRGEGYAGKLVPLQRMLLSTDSALVYYDTLPVSQTPKIYSYAVADENTSYNVSPQSARLPVIYGGVTPIPTRVKAIKTGNAIFITWEKISSMQLLTGFNIYRTATDEQGVQQADKQLVTPTPVVAAANSYVDSVINDGWHYSYVVQAVGVQPGDVSSFSSNASITIPLALPSSPANVSVIGSQQNVTLRWDMPADPAVKTVRIYRAGVNEEFKLLKELPAGSTEFSDTGITANTTYFYSLSTATAKSRESKKTDAVGIRVAE